MSRRGVYMSVYEHVTVDVDVDLTQATEEQLLEALAIVQGTAKKDTTEFINPVHFTIERAELEAIRSTYLRGHKEQAEIAMERLICDALGTAI